MKRIAITLCAGFALAGTVAAADAPKKGVCSCGDSCTCKNCPENCPLLKGETIHVSPDGTVNRLCPDGVYRAVPGAAKQKPAPAAPAFAYPRYLPPAQTCPGGNCPNAPRYFR